MSRAIRSGARHSAPALLPICFVAVFLSWPMLFTTSGMAQDWPNHLWFLWQQGLNIQRDGLPSLFLSKGPNIFYPFYAFYGGTLYALAGGLSAILGDAPVKAYVLSYMLGFGAAMGGFYWMARMAGVSRWLAHVPGFVFVTSSYVLTNVYARGAWPEFIAVCDLPLLIAALLAVLRDKTLRPAPACLLAVTTALLFGSHNITMLWGLTFLGLVGATLLLTVPEARALVTRGALMRIASIAVPAAMIDAWFLLPNVAYESRTQVASVSTPAQIHTLLQLTSPLVSMSHLFTFSRASAVENLPGVDNSPDFALSLPIQVIAWVFIAGFARGVRRRDDAMLRTAWVLIAWGVVFGIVMTHRGLIEALPGPYELVQFQYRLSSYVLLALSGSTVALLAYMSGQQDRVTVLMRWALVPVLIIAAAGAGVQVAEYPQIYPDRNIAFAAGNSSPASMYSPDDYYDASLPVVPKPPLTLFFPPPEIRRDRIVLPYPSYLEGRRVSTNLVGAPYLVGAQGARVEGVLQDGTMVLLLRPSNKARPTVTLSRSSRLPVELGRIVSGLGIIWLTLSLLGSALYPRWRARRRRAATQESRYQST